jgi:hypothetical protein
VAQNCARAEPFHFEAFGQVVLPQPDHGVGCGLQPAPDEGGHRVPWYAERARVGRVLPGNPCCGPS